MRRRTMLVFACLVLALAMTTPTVASAQDSPAFQTGEDAMLVDAGNLEGVEITPLLTVGEPGLPGGYVFEAIPDGISVRVNDDDQIEVYVNHETSKVPFPYNPGLAVSEPGESQNDFDNAQVSKLVFDWDGENAEFVSGSFAIPSSAGFQRFCSNFLATEAEGFTRDILFTNEEGIDYVFRKTDSWQPPPTPGDPAEEQIGLAVALDVKTGDYHPIYGMGRHNHENSVAIPGFDKLVVLSGDDTFTSGPLTIPPGGPLTAGIQNSQSQLYSYMAGNTKNLLADKGDLWAFVSDDPAVDDYYDLTPGSTDSVSGRFIKVPRRIATGLDSDGSELKAEDVGFPPPPGNGSWQRDLRVQPQSGAPGLDGPQWVLEYWSQLHNVFDFVRVEDIAYDKRPGMENVVYVVDSGRGRATATDTPFPSTNGRIWKLVLNPDDPKEVDSLSVFVEGDDNTVKTLTEIRQPDNLETTATGMLVTEDPGSSQQYVVTDASGRTAGLWYVPYSGTGAELVATVDQSADENSDPTAGLVDEDPADVGPTFAGGAFPISPGNLGAWESSGIVDASAAFGEGAFLIDVQAHTFAVEWQTGQDTWIDADSAPDYNFKREGGQLLLIRIPGI